MATTYRDLYPGDAILPASNPAAPVQFVGTNFPVPGLAFDASTLETAFFRLKALGYGSGNVTLSLDWYADTASTGAVIWGAALAAITPDADTQDIETKAFATENTVTDTHIGTTGQRLHTATITISNLDGLANFDDLTLRLVRRAADGGDTMTGDAIVTSLLLSYSDT